MVQVDLWLHALAGVPVALGKPASGGKCEGRS